MISLLATTQNRVHQSWDSLSRTGRSFARITWDAAQSTWNSRGQIINMIEPTIFFPRSAIQLERTLNEVELTLSKYAAYPVIGTIPAVAKVAMGSLQLLGGVSYGVIGGILVLSGKDLKLEHSWTHIKHGAGNIIAGSFEAIAFVGSFLYLVRILKGMNGMDVPGVQLYSGHQENFMPYSSLLDRDMGFDSIGFIDEETATCTRLTQETDHRFQNQPDGQSKGRYQIAKEVFREFKNNDFSKFTK